MNHHSDSIVFDTHPSEDWELTVAMPDDGACAQRPGFSVIYSSKTEAERVAAVWLKRGAESANVVRVW